MSVHVVRWAVAGVVVGLGCGAGLARAGTNHTYTPYPPYTGGLAEGTGTPADLWWANSFDAPAGGEWITRVDASFEGGLANGTPISVLIYQDPNNDGDPSDLQLLRRLDTTVNSSSGATDLYMPQGFAVPPTYVSGNFFVAVEANNVPASAYFPIELTNPQNRSYWAYNKGTKVGTMTPTTLGDSTLPPVKIDTSEGQTAPTYDVFLGARGRPTEYGRAQDPLVIDSFDTGDFNITSNGIQVAAPGAVGGKHGATYIGSGSVSVANGVLSLTGGQASVFYGWKYYSGTGYQAGYDTYMHANLDGYDLLRIHFDQYSPYLHLSGMGLSYGAYTPDADGNIDVPISGQDWTDVNTLDLTIYSYSGTTVIGSITLLATPIPGDVNGDGRINADDYALIDRGYHDHLTGHVNGDLNADGTVDAADYLQIDTAFALAGNPLSPQFLADRQQEFGDAYVTQLLASVPEPAGLGFAAALVTLVGRRRHHRGV